MCIEHGIRTGMGTSILQEKRGRGRVLASLSGITLCKQAGRNPFTLILQNKASFREFLESEVRYFTLLRTFPDIAEELFAQAEADAKDRYAEYRRLAAMEY